MHRGKFRDSCLYVIRRCARFLCLLAFRLRSRGPGNVPRTGGVLLAVNHQSYLDPLLVAACVDRAVYFMARKSLFKNFMFGALIRFLGAFPVERDQADTRSVRLAIDLLRGGNVVLVFPEGTRTRDGRIGAMKKGIGMLARKSGAAIVPTLLDGAFEAWPRTAALPAPVPISVGFGKPIALCAFATDEDLAQGVQEALVGMQENLSRTRDPVVPRPCGSE
ncbi:MAG: lysophospholipid acyltransferase family protein [Planctomycetota bacterium]|nr:lysophospholipid acyltransferase family protein [Planctomycetota bacterium]